MAPSSPGATRRGGDGPPARKRKERASSSPSMRARRGRSGLRRVMMMAMTMMATTMPRRIKSQKQRKNQTNRFGAGDESRDVERRVERRGRQRRGRRERNDARTEDNSERMVRAVRRVRVEISRGLRAIEMRRGMHCRRRPNGFQTGRGKEEEKKKERNLDEISPYDALDSGCLLFEDMWNVRSRAMEEHLSGTSTTVAAIDSTTTLAMPSMARKRLEKMMKYKEKEEASKAFDGIGTFEQLLVQKKSQLANVLDPVCHCSASNSALKEPTAKANNLVGYRTRAGLLKSMKKDPRPRNELRD